jgi:hypothetical protein
MQMENRIKNLIKQGIFHQDELFRIVYAEFPIHYSKVREAIHAAKTN